MVGVEGMIVGGGEVTEGITVGGIGVVEVGGEVGVEAEAEAPSSDGQSTRGGEAKGRLFGICSGIIFHSLL